MEQEARWIETGVINTDGKVAPTTPERMLSQTTGCYCQKGHMYLFGVGESIYHCFDNDVLSQGRFVFPPSLLCWQTHAELLRLPSH